MFKDEKSFNEELFDRERYKIPYTMRKIEDFINNDDKYLSSFRNSSNFYPTVLFSETNVVGDCHYFSEELQTICEKNNVNFFFGTNLKKIKKRESDDLLVICERGENETVEINAKNGQ